MKQKQARELLLLYGCLLGLKSSIKNERGTTDYRKDFQVKMIDSHTNEKNILVVDDDPLVLETASLLLTRRGYTVFSCENAREAISLFTEF